MASRSSDSKLQELLSQLKTDGVQALDQLMDAYEERRAQRAAQLRATLRYVTPPTEEQLAQIRDFLRKKYQSEDLPLDLVEDKSQKVIDTFESAIRERMSPFKDFPIIFASALTKQRIFKVLETAKDVYLHRTSKIGTTKLNETMLPLIEAYPPPSIKGKYIKIKYCSQVPNTQIPSFVFYANLPQYVKEPYKRFLENKIRENWNLSGTPINIFIRQK